MSKDAAQAMAWTRKAADKGLPAAEVALGDCVLEWRWREEGRGGGVSGGFQRRPGRGIRQECLTWGGLTRRGYGVEADDGTAMEWFEKSAKAGLPRGEWKLGLMDFKSSVRERDKEEAVAWFEKAADAGFAPAETVMAWCYIHGVGVDQNAATGIAWDKKAAMQGNVEAQQDLVARYRRGIGVAKDEAEAAKWARMLAASGNLAAKLYLADLYTQGRGCGEGPRGGFPVEHGGGEDGAGVWGSGRWAWLTGTDGAWRKTRRRP